MFKWEHSTLLQVLVKQKVLEQCRTGHRLGMYYWNFNSYEKRDGANLNFRCPQRC